MPEQLQSCKITFNAAVGLATLCSIYSEPYNMSTILICSHRYSSIRHTHITEEIRQTFLAREDISSAITSTDTQLATVERNLGRFFFLSLAADRVRMETI
jgi:hypothetical protein